MNFVEGPMPLRQMPSENHLLGVHQILSAITFLAREPEPWSKHLALWLTHQNFDKPGFLTGSEGGNKVFSFIKPGFSVRD
ncbi:hypothetical protein QUA41_22450 [Microcoleus sp. Pol11C1]|uniref:hypothetical protein n=1 Tax=unclassified Microcoleus TaxID=2642155 RepID=UPI002FD2C75D